LAGARQPLLVLASFGAGLENGKTSEEVLVFGGLWEVLDERPARLVFLFLGGFLLRCHELYPSV